MTAVNIQGVFDTDNEEDLAVVQTVKLARERYRLNSTKPVIAAGMNLLRAQMESGGDMPLSGELRLQRDTKEAIEALLTACKIINETVAELKAVADAIIDAGGVVVDTSQVVQTKERLNAVDTSQLDAFQISIAKNYDEWEFEDDE